MKMTERNMVSLGIKNSQDKFTNLGYILSDQSDVSAKIDIKCFRRKEIVSYLGASLREMILNAFVHADYFIRSNIKIEFLKTDVKLQVQEEYLMPLWMKL